MKRRNKYGILKHVDTPMCCECKSPMDLPPDTFAELAADDLSGAVREVHCPNCNAYQHVSPSIEWQSWRCDVPF
jgi:hypothetical protein